jgi:hypothetical protein
MRFSVFRPWERPTAIDMLLHQFARCGSSRRREGPLQPIEYERQTDGVDEDHILTMVQRAQFGCRSCVRPVVDYRIQGRLRGAAGPY